MLKTFKILVWENIRKMSIYRLPYKPPYKIFLKILTNFKKNSKNVKNFKNFCMGKNKKNDNL